MTKSFKRNGITRRALCVLFAQAVLCLCSMAATTTNSWVYYDAGGHLAYKTWGANGDKIMDFSTAGFMGGGVALPTNGVVRTNLTAGGGDRTADIVNAIKYVGALATNADGFCGVVLLGPGTFLVSSQINFNVSGVVLRGSGSGAGGTTLVMTTNATYWGLFNIGEGKATVLTNTVNLTDSYVPSGATTFNVSSTAGYSVGDEVYVNRPVTQAWLDYMQMSTNYLGWGKIWLGVGSFLHTDRVIKAINGNQITLDAPLTDSFDSAYLGTPVGNMQKCTWGKLVNHVGLEHLKIQCPGLNVYNNPFWMDYVADAWVSDVVMQDGTGMTVGRQAKRVTIDNVIYTHTISITGGPADFACNGSQILFNKCQSLGYDSWPFVTQSTGSGPIVVLNFYTTQKGGISPHQRWTKGLLADNCFLPNGGGAGVEFWNRGGMGSGQGWCTAWSVAWNVITPDFMVQLAPGTADWVIGGSGLIIQIDSLGIYDHFKSIVTPHSLYLAQLQERLGSAAVENIGYPLFSLSVPPSVSVQRVTNATFAVTVGDPSVFGNNVALSVTGVPAGASATLSTNSVTGTGTSLLTITASNSMALGNYTLNVIGANAGLTHTSTVAFAVVNFGMSASPTSRSVAGGGTNTTYTITLTTNSSFSGSVNFDVSGLPASTTVAFDPTPLSGAGSTTLTVTTTSNTPSGTYALTVNGTNSGGVGIALASLTVASPPYWTGAGSDGYWSDAANWNATAIQPNNNLVFGGNFQINNTNDTPAGTAYSAIAFNPGADAFVLNGNPITLAGGGITNNSGSLQTINFGLNFSTNLTLRGGGGGLEGDNAVGLVVVGGLTNTLASGTTTLNVTGTGTLVNQLGGGTNMLAVGDVDANWTLVDNAASTPVTVPWSYAINYGTFNFGTTNSAPTLTVGPVSVTVLPVPVVGSKRQRRLRPPLTW
jgi:hypothetical protein